MIRVIVVAPTALACDAIALALSDEADVEIIGKATTPEAAVARSREGCLVLASVDLPGSGAMQVVRELPRRVPRARVIVVGVPAAAGITIEYLEAGAMGLVPQSASMAELVEHVRAARRGRIALAPEVAGRLVARLAHLARTCDEHKIDVASLGSLTPREREVLERLAAGESNQEIADRLAIGIGTAKNHVHSILAKLGLERREDAALYARMVGRRTQGG